jgi:GNAT superfamily N-acetyltransferase
MTERNVSVRPAKLKDAESIEKILRELKWFDHINENSISDIVSKIKDYIRFCQGDSCHNIFVAEKDEEIVGYIAIHWLFYAFLRGPEGYISELFVSKKERGCGIGSLLIEELKNQAQRKGCSRLMLANNRNRLSYEKGFYKKNGFIEREHIANFILPFE